MHRIHVALIDPDPVMADRLRPIIHRSEVLWVGSFATVEAFIRFKQAHPVDIVLLSDTIALPQRVIHIVRRLQRLDRNLRVVILSEMLNLYAVKHLPEMGVAGFLYRRDHLEAILVDALLRVDAGQFYVSPTAGALTYIRHTNDTLNLNETDRSVLWLMAQGQTPGEIALILDLTPRSVYRIRGKLRAELNARTNELIVDTARSLGLFDALS